MLSNDYNYNVGWQCPICKHVYSPTVTQCPYCGNSDTVASDHVTIDASDFINIEKNGDAWTLTGNPPYDVSLTTTGYAPEDNEFKDKVIKALELCKALNYNPNLDNCDECPYYDESEGTCNTMGDILRDALKVIKGK